MNRLGGGGSNIYIDIGAIEIIGLRPAAAAGCWMPSPSLSVTRGAIILLLLPADRRRSTKETTNGLAPSSRDRMARLYETLFGFESKYTFPSPVTASKSMSNLEALFAI